VLKNQETLFTNCFIHWKLDNNGTLES